MKGLGESMSSYQPGQIVYIIIRNPHTQDVANVQQAAVVQNPDNPEQLSLFIYETYYPLTEEVAVYSSAEEAEFAYQDAFGISEMEGYYG
ncbi:transcriptional regulator SplA domain-containing protein [Neobacillus sp. OS1-33]|jgi:transcriptional regulator of the spore photoproduct lyase operon|uniref:transcriptional regulator SplA domain-containing protein n=1 Tax=Neobacillus sp. OS1-33 TaxID=3070683 RepID=UPI0027E06EA4|nr:transcriptional regulator SplA domain-containing protein [Neobacillus sp. OS1-33]WML27106.1 transcriptional regulator SplA domain-containing protein [Neobacillus sp. OS1-33]